MFGLGVLRGEEDRASMEIDMFDLDVNKLADPAAELVDDFEHQFVLVGVNTIKELAQFLDGKVPDDFSKTFIGFTLLAFSTLNFQGRGAFLQFHCHHNIQAKLVNKSFPSIVEQK